MRRLFIALVCCLLLATGVQAASSVTQMQTGATVSANGSCQVTVTFQLRLEALPGELTFPLPGNAYDISVNAQSVRTHFSQGLRRADLLEAITAPGTHTLTVRYSLPNLVSNVKGKGLTLTLPLLSGFSYPMDSFSFSVTLPGELQGVPEFLSTYYQEDTSSVISYTVDGATLSGTMTVPLKDHETLTLTLPVTREMFPQNFAKRWQVDVGDLVLYGLAGLALVYWLAGLRCLPPRRVRRSTPPEGLTAGEVGCALSGQGGDLTLMVISWAQMGYLLIHITDNGRVLLYKRMDMGNERSDFEAKIFRSLFGQRSRVDGTGLHYAQLCGKVRRTVTRRGSFYRRRSANAFVFRVLSAAIGFAAGICLALSWVPDTSWRVLLSIALAPVGTLCAWAIQSFTVRFRLRRTPQVTLSAAACCLLWVALCLWAEVWDLAVFLLVTQALTGLAAAFGGRRTQAGRQTASELLGLRRHLRNAPSETLRRSLQQNPDYFYQLAPFALALGVDRRFAAQFGGKQMPGCHWLTTGMDGHMTATEWNKLLRQAVNALNDRQEKRLLERFRRK